MIDPDMYSLSELIVVNRYAKELAGNGAPRRLLDSGTATGDSSYIEWVLYQLEGPVADGMRRLFDVPDGVVKMNATGELVSLRHGVDRLSDTPDGVVKLHVQETFMSLRYGIRLTCGDRGQKFEGVMDRDNLFEHAAVWLHDELKRKEWKDAGNAPALFDGAL